MGTITGTALGASIDNGPAVPAELTIETEQIDVTPSVETKPDPKWSYVDAAGHFHAWDNGDELPTLATRSRHIPCADEGCEGYDEPYYVCLICGEEIEPGTITFAPTERRFAPGRKSWEVVVAADVTAERVSVRLVAGDRILFGVATPVGGEIQAGGRVRTRLAGIGPLGQREAVTGRLHAQHFTSCSASTDRRT